MDALTLAPGAAGAVAAAWAAYTFNRLVAGRNRVEQAFGDIEVQLKRRHDLIPKLVDVVKGAMKHERETLKEITEARGAALRAPDRPARLGAEAALSALLVPFLARVEAYPSLKANQNALDLQEEIRSTENRIAYVRTHLNTVCFHYNNLCRQFPSLLLALPLGHRPLPYFEAAPSEREAPSTSLS